MGYKVTLYTRKSSFSLDNFYPSGHTFIGFSSFPTSSLGTHITLQ
jgi:hypothetical protein